MRVRGGGAGEEVFLGFGEFDAIEGLIWGDCCSGFEDCVDDLGADGDLKFAEEF